MTQRLFDGASTAAGGLAGAVRHLAWYFSYCVDGSSTRECAVSEPAADARLRRVS